MSEVKAKLTKRVIYDIEVGEIKTENFKIKSRWEGFLKLENDKKQVIFIEDPTSIQEFFNQMRDSVSDVTIYKLSPDLMLRQSK